MREILERILKMRIVTAMQSKVYLDQNQHGFREGHSTITALKFLKVCVKDIVVDYKYCDLVDIDIEGAFDIMEWPTLAEIVGEIPVAEYQRSSLKIINVHDTAISSSQMT